MEECICNNPEAWGYTCPVHRQVCRAMPPLRDAGRGAGEDYWRGYDAGLRGWWWKRECDNKNFMRGYRDGVAEHDQDR